jgi:hypothetical protein
MVESFKIPWFIFSDGEANAIAAVNVALTAVGQDVIPNNPRVIVLPQGKKFEDYIVADATKDTLIAAIVKIKAQNYQHLKALEKEWAAKSKADQLAAIVVELQAHKAQYGSFVGKELAIPSAVEDLFKKIDVELGPTKSAKNKA